MKRIKNLTISNFSMFLLPITILQSLIAYLKANSLPIPEEAPVITITDPAFEYLKMIILTFKPVPSKSHCKRMISHLS